MKQESPTKCIMYIYEYITMLGMMLLYEFITNIILHFLILMIIPMTKIIVPSKYHHKKKVGIFFVAILLSLILTILFPVHLSNHTVFDLMYIPIFICFFYVHKYTGLCLLFFALIYRLFESDTSDVFLIVNYLVLAFIFHLLTKFYQKSSLRKKILIGLLFYIPIASTRMIIFIKNQETQFFIQALFLVFVYALTLILIIYMIEMHQSHLLMRETIQAADKLNAISQLAASIAHEIRNPMTTVKGFMQLMHAEQNLTKTQIQYIEVSLKELERTNQMINDFLTLSKPANNTVITFDLIPIIQEVTEFMKSYAHLSNIQLQCKITHYPIYIDGNANELKQLLINFIKNAIEAINENGTVEIEVFSLKNKVKITVRDNGKGMSKDELSRIGQPYFSTKTRGTGLGLMIAFDIIKKMNGKYEIESNEDEGTAIHLYFSTSDSV